VTTSKNIYNGSITHTNSKLSYHCTFSEWNSSSLPRGYRWCAHWFAEPCCMVAIKWQCKRL